MAFIGPANWPDSLKLRECLANIFDNSINADVLFEVRTGNKNADGSNETEIIKAHSFVLERRSTYLASQINFCKGRRTNPNDPIIINDITEVFASEFKPMLRFLYTEETFGINEQNIAAIYSAAKFYEMHHLERTCLDLTKLDSQCARLFPPNALIDEKNILDLLTAAKNHRETLLHKSCWAFINAKVLDVLNEHLTRLAKDEMNSILKRNTLFVDENELFKLVVKWAKLQCNKSVTAPKETEELPNEPKETAEQTEEPAMDKEESFDEPEHSEQLAEPSGEQIREALGNLLFKIRFPLISPMIFLSEIVPMGILNSKEILSMLLWYANTDRFAAYPKPFSAKHRKWCPRENKLVDKAKIDAKKANLEKEMRALMEQIQKNSE